MKKVFTCIYVFAVMAFMGFVAVGCGGNTSFSENNAGDASGNGEEAPNKQEDISTTLEGSTWWEVDAITRTWINGWERNHYPCMRRLYYFHFINDNKVEITRWEEPYRMDGEMKLLDSMVCDYKYDNLNGTISCPQSSKCTFNISQLQDGHSCYPDVDIYYMEIQNFSEEKERLTLLFTGDNSGLIKELIKFNKRKDRLL